MATQYEILSMRERGIEQHIPDFNEALYEQLKQTPWYLASAALHLVGFALLNALVGSSGGLAPVQATIDAAVAQDETQLEGRSSRR